MNDFSNSNQVIRNVHFSSLGLQQRRGCEQEQISLDYSSGVAVHSSTNLWSQTYPDPTSRSTNNTLLGLGSSDASVLNHGLSAPHSYAVHCSEYQHQQDLMGINSGTEVGGLETTLQPSTEMFHYGESSGCPILGWTEMYSEQQWQLMGSHDLDSWGLPLSSPASFQTSNITAPTDFSFKHTSMKLQPDHNNIPSSTKSTSSHHTLTTTHEDYQQDVLIQQEFQRLDEMLLRDDDDDLSCLSDVDQVSVESVVSSEQQYDSPSPWEPHEPQLVTVKEESPSELLSTAAEPSEFTMSIATATKTSNTSRAVSDLDPDRASCHVGMNNNNNSRSSIVPSRVAPVVEEFHQNCERLISENQQKIPLSLSHCPSETVGTTTTATTGRTLSTIMQAAEQPVPVNLKKPSFRPKILGASTHTTSQDIHRRVPAHINEGPQQPHRYPEQKRNLEHLRIEEAPQTEGIPATTTATGYQACSVDTGGSLAAEFQSQGIHAARRTGTGAGTTSSLPRIRMEQQQQQPKRSPIQQLCSIKNAQAQNYSNQNMSVSQMPCQGQSQGQGQPQSQNQNVQNQNIQNSTQRSSFRKKPSTVASTPIPPEIVAPTPTNMMGISHGDGVWGAIPEMNARMYLPHGVLHFKMEYQPTESRNIAFPISTQLPTNAHHSPSQPQSQQHQSGSPSNLAKFTHPVIHMLPLSSDGSTRLNVTFDVLYQN